MRRRFDNLRRWSRFQPWVEALEGRWAPHAGQVSMRFEGMTVPATRGLTPAECATLVPAYDLATAQPIVEDGPPLPGQVEAFDAQRLASSVFKLGMTIGSTNGEPSARSETPSSFDLPCLPIKKEGKNNVLALGGNFVWVWLISIPAFIAF